MSHLFCHELNHLDPIKHMFPNPRGVLYSDDRRFLSGIIHVVRNGLR